MTLTLVPPPLPAAPGACCGHTDRTTTLTWVCSLQPHPPTTAHVMRTPQMTSPLHDLIRRTLADGTTPGCPPRRDYIDPEDIDAMATELEQALVNAPTLDGPPLTDTEFWCPVRNAYADPSCGTQGVGVSHGHYDVEVDAISGAVLTPPEVQALRRRVASYYVAPDGYAEVGLWRGQPGDTRPELVLHRADFDGHPALWDHLVAGLRVQS